MVARISTEKEDKITKSFAVIFTITCFGAAVLLLWAGMELYIPLGLIFFSIAGPLIFFPENENTQILGMEISLVGILFLFLGTEEPLRSTGIILFIICFIGTIYIINRIQRRDRWT